MTERLKNQQAQMMLESLKRRLPLKPSAYDAYAHGQNDAIQFAIDLVTTLFEKEEE
jgi:hypothetical protein